MTQHNLTQILKVIRDLVMRNRPCYRDYLGNGQYKTKLLPEYLLPEFLRKDKIASKTEVNSAASKATAAADAASNAQRTANNAQSTANTAKTTADTARSTANTAKTTADAAKTTADAALPKSGGEVSGAIKSSSSIEFPRNYTTSSAAGLQIDSSISSKVLTNYLKSTGVSSSLYSYIESVVTRLDGIVIYNPNKLINGKTVTIAAEGERLDFSESIGKKPITISAKDIILSSSTANSTKRFRITVDDTGTLKATEVTS